MRLIERWRRARRLGSIQAEPLSAVASSVAIIMDGNGRWARRRGLPVGAGHRAGVRALRRTVEAAIELEVRSLCVYAFSTENWERPDEEVADLLDLLAETIRGEFTDLARQGVRTRFVGRRDRCSPGVAAMMQELEQGTAQNNVLDLFVCFDYGGRAELVEAARRLVREGVPADRIDDEAVRSRLAAPKMPDPDLLVRTSGEQRISNFLLWQLAYAELVFTDTLWPDFGRDDLRDALATFASRRRRFGGR